MQQGKLLYELQEIDLRLAANAKRLQDIAAALSDNEAVQTAQAQVDSAETALQPLRTNMRDLELQLQSTRDKRANTESRLYSGSVTNPKELQDMQQEIESLTNWLAELEERLLDAMVAVEAAEETLQDAEANLSDVTQQVAAENQDLLSEQQALQSESETLERRRPTVVAKIDPANLELYETMRPQKANQPLARLTAEETCSACGIKQTGIAAKSIRQGESLQTCRNCKRILVAI